MQGGVDNNTIIAEEFNTPLLTRYRSSRQKINMEIMNMNYTSDQMDLTEQSIQQQQNTHFFQVQVHTEFP